MSTEQIANWYSTISQRERMVLQVGAVAVIAAIVALTFLPLNRNLREATAKLEKQKSDLEWMKQVGETLAAAGPGPASVATAESLAVLIDRSARESGLAQALTGTSPGTNGGMRVQLERADFNMLAGWISRLSSQHGVRVESATITGSSTPGIVSATVQLRAR